MEKKSDNARVDFLDEGSLLIEQLSKQIRFKRKLTWRKVFNTARFKMDRIKSRSHHAH